jgi:hypothetical protein
VIGVEEGVPILAMGFDETFLYQAGWVATSDEVSDEVTITETVYPLA